MLTIDGSMGEGGGQVLRTSLALALLTRTPVRVTRIRACRKSPGLMRQHVMAVRAARSVGRAVVQGDALGSTELTFTPYAVEPGRYTFRIEGAGSTMLVLTTVFLPLALAASGPSELVLEGGTHNPLAPSFESLDQALLPPLRRAGLDVTLTLDRHGFYPVGGGALRARIAPLAPDTKLERVELLTRGEVHAIRAQARVARLPETIGARELAVLRAALPLDQAEVRTVESYGPGNVAQVVVESEGGVEVFGACGEKRKQAEAVARELATEVRSYLDADVPVGEHLADQLLLPLALGSGGAFRTVAPSGHTLTQIELLRRFLGTEIRVERESELAYRVEVPARTTGDGRPAVS